MILQKKTDLLFFPQKKKSRELKKSFFPHLLPLGVKTKERERERERERRRRGRRNKKRKKKCVILQSMGVFPVLFLCLLFSLARRLLEVFEFQLTSCCLMRQEILII